MSDTNNSAAVQQTQYRLPVKNLVFGIVGFVYGVNSILCSCLFIFALPYAIIGMVFSILSLKNSRFRLAKAGRICSIIGLALTILFMIFTVILLIVFLQNGGFSGNGVGDLSGAYVGNAPININVGF